MLKITDVNRKLFFNTSIGRIMNDTRILFLVASRNRAKTSAKDCSAVGTAFLPQGQTTKDSDRKE